MSSARLPVLLVLGACATVGYLLWSGPEERIAKLARDGRTGEAALAAEKILRRGHATPHLLTTLARIYESGGKPARAAELLEIHALARPDDPNLLRWLARVYASFGRNDGVAEALVRLVRIQPTRGALTELLALLRLDGRFEEETALLDRFAESGLLEARDLERAALEFAQRGEAVRAATILTRAEAETGGLDERARRLLFELLVEAGDYTEAAARAAEWLAAWRKPWLATPLVLRLAQVAPAEPVDALAQASSTLFPDTRFYLAKALAEAGHTRPATALVAGWPHPGTAPGETEIASYVAVAAATGDRSLLLRAIAALRGGADLEAQAILAEAVAGTYGLVQLAAVWPDLTPEVLLRRPLLGVRFAGSTGQAALARWVATNADLGALRPAEQDAWLKVLRAECGPFGAYALLDRQARRGELPAGFQAAYRILAAETGHLTPTRREQASFASVARLAR